MAPRRCRLAVVFAPWFSCAIEELPANLAALARTQFLPTWDALTPKQRKRLAEQRDEQHPVDAADEERIGIQFRHGFNGIAAPRRNSKNAKMPRPSRQKISAAAILKLKQVLEAKDLPSRKQCAAAHGLATAGGKLEVSIQAFRRRWNQLGLKAHSKKEP